MGVINSHWLRKLEKLRCALLYFCKSQSTIETDPCTHSTPKQTDDFALDTCYRKHKSAGRKLQQTTEDLLRLFKYSEKPRDCLLHASRSSATLFSMLLFAAIPKLCQRGPADEACLCLCLLYTHHIQPGSRQELFRERHETAQAATKTSPTLLLSFCSLYFHLPFPQQKPPLCSKWSIGCRVRLRVLMNLPGVSCQIDVWHSDSPALQLNVNVLTACSTA